MRGRSPSGNPEGILPQSPGLRRRGATLGARPTYHQPLKGCAEGSNGLHGVLGVYLQILPGGLFIPTNEPHPIPPFDIAPSDVHERHNPLRGRERDLA